MSIHPTACVDPGAEIAPDAEIGAFTVIADRVRIGSGTVVESHVRIGSRFGRVAIGERNLIQSGSVLGGPPQDLGYASGFDDALLEIGDGNRIGEYVTISLGTEKGGGTTRVGNDNFLMAYTHVGHDCRLGNGVVLTNLAQIAGHVEIDDHAILSGHSGVTQFVRLGAYSFLAGGSYANKDIPPFTIAEGYWATVRATNKVALKRAGFDAQERRNIDRAVRLVLDSALTIPAVVERIRGECAPSPQIDRLVAFLESSRRGIAR
ncbi:MAG TPA: acyl-ACP--UDP-N-acetylglucosamine O-acyltransferase [Gammaproteobacteria bacterium]